MGVKGKLVEIRWRAAGHYRPLGESFVAPLAGARALEIGGPSTRFQAGDLLPVYPVLDSVDGVQFAAETAWHSLDAEKGYAPEGRRRGELRIVDDLDLREFADASYDAVISSHVLEHFANPLRALAAWRRVTREGGYLLVVLPHMAGSIDHRRALTPLSHMIEDLERNTGEDDLTHLEETLLLHDRSRDTEEGDQQTWADRRRANATTRLLHHHTFTTPSALLLLDHAGLELLAAETRYPHDIYALGRWPARGERPDNARFLATPRRSPFRVDHAARSTD